MENFLTFETLEEYELYKEGITTTDDWSAYVKENGKTYVNYSKLYNDNVRVLSKERNVKPTITNTPSQTQTYLNI